jgi:signal peptide peptidase SppA
MNFIKQAFTSGGIMLIDPSIAIQGAERHDKLLSVIDPKAADFTKILAMLCGEPPKYEVIDNIGYIPLHGVMSKGLSVLEKHTGGIDTEDVASWMKQAAEDPKVEHVIMDVNSPGGSVVGTEELANAYRALGKVKPTISYCDGRACSAAYWVASQGNRFLVTPSSMVGNVGAYAAYPDMTGALEKQGIKVNVIKSGKFKAMGHPAISMTDEQKEWLQKDMDATHDQFKTDVRKVRQFAKDEDMDGQTWTGRDAAAKNLVTGMVYGWDDAISRIQL